MILLHLTWLREGMGFDYAKLTLMVERMMKKKQRRIFKRMASA